MTIRTIVPVARVSSNLLELQLPWSVLSFAREFGNSEMPNYSQILAHNVLEV